ncbi:MAG TPA: hypothetical protein VKE24_04050 [Candidatus Acidoferrales bacterium]|nr:hypothetical protein [Candidatus Acidoferrales bacterium]
MSSTRRYFFRSAAAGALCNLTCFPWHTPPVDAGEPRRQSRPDGMQPIDYGLSFICNTSPANAVRFWIESRTRLIDTQAGTTIDFYQCASCKSEHTFAEKNLLQKDNYDFLPILGDGHWLIFRRPARVWERYRQVSKAEDIWGKPVLKLRPPAKITSLDTWEKIRDATAAGVPIVTQTELASEQSGLRAVIEAPTKTMNISLQRKMYQVDTGPVAFPDLSKRFQHPIECLSLAFVVFNASHFADFVIEQPTPVLQEGKQTTKTYHYSNPFSLPAKNRLFALGGR